MKLSDPWRIVRFAFVGGMSTIIYSISAYMLTVLFGQPAVLASILAYILGAIFSFLSHRNFTFRSSRPVSQEAPRFAGISFAGWIIAVLAPLILTDGLGLPPIIAIVVTAVAVPVLSFVGMERFVFRGRIEIEDGALHEDIERRLGD